MRTNFFSDFIKQLLADELADTQQPSPLLNNSVTTPTTDNKSLTDNTLDEETLVAVE